jgi:DNA-binding response OmpR family regulator
MKKRILVIDDDQEILAFMRTYLEHHGYDVYLAADSKEGYRIARATPPDLILLDVMMPGGSGMEAHGKLRNAREWPIPIIIFSAAPSFLIHGKVPQLDAADVIPKSEDLVPLLNRIRHHLPAAS